jgi:hypothetical protein
LKAGFGGDLRFAATQEARDIPLIRAIRTKVSGASAAGLIQATDLQHEGNDYIVVASAATIAVGMGVIINGTGYGNVTAISGTPVALRPLERH